MYTHLERHLLERVDSVTTYLLLYHEVCARESDPMARVFDQGYTQSERYSCFSQGSIFIHMSIHEYIHVYRIQFI